MSQDPYDISPLLSEDGWTFNMSGDDWVMPAYQCGGVRVTEIGARPFDALRLEAPVDVARDFLLSGIVVDDQLVPGLLEAPSSLHPPGEQPFNAWIEIRRWRADRPVILEIYNRCPSRRAAPERRVVHGLRSIPETSCWGPIRGPSLGA
jgi:hypothetical protein